MPMVTSVALKPVTDSLNTTVKWIGEVLVGSVCPAAWLMVTFGLVVSMTKDSAVEVGETFPAVSVAVALAV